MKLKAILFGLLAGFAVTAQGSKVVADPCAAFLREFFGLAYLEDGASWPNHSLSARPVGDQPNGVERAAWIATLVLTRGDLFRDLKREMPQWLEFDEEAIEKFGRALELLEYLPRSRQLAARLDLLTPDEGKILIMGGGTGILPGFLLSQNPRRKLTLLDTRPETGLLAKRRLEVLFPAAGVEYVPKYTPTRDPLPRQTYDMAIAREFYYRLSPSIQAEFLDDVAEALVTARRRGTAARFVLIEPIRGRESKVPAFLRSSLRQAVEMRVPHNEFEVAMVAATLSGSALTLLSGSPVDPPPFAAADEILERAGHAGLTLVSRDPAPDGICDVFVFEKR